MDFLVCFLGGARTRLFFLAPPSWSRSVEGAGDTARLEGAGDAARLEGAGDAARLEGAAVFTTLGTDPGLPALVWGEGVVAGPEEGPEDAPPD